MLYVHGVPTRRSTGSPSSSAIGGVAPDLPGFGRSAKPADFDYSISGYDRFLEAFAEHAGLERFSLVVHDWGGSGSPSPSASPSASSGSSCSAACRSCRATAGTALRGPGARRSWASC